ncbi:DUF1892-domain-containing protein [Metschnikowia bicuspidata var. bicuspidata NRRL YB-4993]|uniref:DUF1892-domain-containing protein n=1 Tax=Metschnikowia bicuspidata var. bicuspidata NRRL YB-4993 TaxID=869754 RepID=A0A1A0H5P9_9ASCO|nr:DUF1892-domain-containing protein [Metschnikowia bicuspidata var. bicuspidata NRRL YB-4993]OBA19232.1 DUF1892-domain-containing protein [Metschnikowia bicuspidata var. bicuspidata NRRL YB-4993]
MAEESDIVFKTDQDGDLDNPLRAIIVVNSLDAPEGDMEERMLDGVQTFDEVDAFFDKFDEKVAFPNEEHIKYEVGSDGLVVLVVDSLELKSKVIEFLDDFVRAKDETKGEDIQTNEGEASESSTKRSKSS